MKLVFNELHFTLWMTKVYVGFYKVLQCLTVAVKDTCKGKQ